jgi:hypothetical protein
VPRRIVAALLAAAAANALAADALGTLFHTPQERERLDRLRRGEAVEAPGAAPAAKRAPTVTGFVKRSDGRDTVWLDGKPLTGAAAAIHLDSAKSRDARSAEKPAIEIRRTR